jgi:hypothetical protein
VRARRAFLGVLLFCLPAVAARAQAVHSVASLAGLAGVEIVVEDLSPGLQELGLSELPLRTDVELRLRQAGVRVVGQVQACDTLPCVYVHVTATTGPRQSAYFVHVGLQQMVRLTRDSSLAFSVETWHAEGRVGMVSGSEMPARVLDAIRSELAQFVNAYHNANPGR